MPAINPRITITASPEAASVVRRLSELNGKSQSSIVAELLDVAVPALERVCLILDAAQRAEVTVKDQLRTSSMHAQARLEEQLGLVLEEFDTVARPLLQAAEAVQRRGAKARGGACDSGASNGDAPASGKGTTPVPVTRGSGHPNPPPPAPKRTGRGRV